MTRNKLKKKKSRGKAWQKLMTLFKKIKKYLNRKKTKKTKRNGIREKPEREKEAKLLTVNGFVRVKKKKIEIERKKEDKKVEKTLHKEKRKKRM